MTYSTTGNPRPGPGERRVSILDFAKRKAAGEKIVMITAYDALFAALVEDAGVDAILVGDSLATVLGAEETTLPVTVDQMIYHGRLVRRGAARALVIVDMPFLSYQVSPSDAVRNAGRILKETGAGAVKLEGGSAVVDTVRALVAAGIPVVGHLGFTPQSVNQLGGPRIQGRDGDGSERLLADAAALEEAGVFSLVLELVPASLAARVSQTLTIPTIGIGAGPGCDGQVLVLHDMLGLNEHFRPRFLKRYAELGTTVKAAVERYAGEVREGAFPGPEHSHD